jgi:DNA ligase-1
MGKREFLALAHVLDLKKHSIGGWFASEKLDGMRCFWDGGITRGMNSVEVPWANTEKDFRLKEQVIATGLWSRYGKVVRAPEWWVARLPNFPLDGELWTGRGEYQKLMSIVKDHDGGQAWDNVKYLAFDVPSSCVFCDGVISNKNYKKSFKGVENWALQRGYAEPNRNTFRINQMNMRKLQWNDTAMPHGQIELPLAQDKAIEHLDKFMLNVLEQGGEGLIVRKPESIWFPSRSYDCLKYKPFLDAEGTIVGYTWGAGKYLGMIGSVRVKFDNVEFDLSGFTDQERTVVGQGKIVGEPFKNVAQHLEAAYFKRGETITFKYRELTDGGVPKEARYFRKRVTE